MGQQTCAMADENCISHQCDQCNEKSGDNANGLHWYAERSFSYTDEEICPRTPSLPSFVKQAPALTDESHFLPPMPDQLTRECAQKEKTNLSRISQLSPAPNCTDSGNSTVSTPQSTAVPSLKDLNAPEGDLDDNGLLHLDFDLAPGLKSGVKLVDLLDEQLVVSSVHPEGPLARTAFGDPGLVANDVILEVDGFPGSPAQLRQRLDDAFTSGAWVSLLVQPRPNGFDVEVKRQGRSWSKLGVIVRIERSDPFKIHVQGLREKGLLPAWNATNGPTLQILAGDCITHVNGVSKTAEEMYKDMQASELGALLRLRICPPDRGSELARSTSLRRMEKENR